MGGGKTFGGLASAISDRGLLLQGCGRVISSGFYKGGFQERLRSPHRLKVHQKTRKIILNDVPHHLIINAKVAVNELIP